MYYYRIFVEKIRNHPQFDTVSLKDKEHNQQTLRKVLPKAEELKKQLLEQYQTELNKYLEDVKEREKIEKERLKQEELEKYFIIFYKLYRVSHLRLEILTLSKSRQKWWRRDESENQKTFWYFNMKSIGKQAHRENFFFVIYMNYFTSIHLQIVEKNARSKLMDSCINNQIFFIRYDELYQMHQKIYDSFFNIINHFKNILGPSLRWLSLYIYIYRNV